MPKGIYQRKQLTDDEKLDQILERTRINWSSMCWELPSKNGGYGQIYPGQFDKKPNKRPRAHRHVYSLFWKVKIPDGLHVCHACDNPPCININHLFLGTRDDNMRDAAKKGRMAKGSQHGRSKLTEDEVLKIRALRASGISQSKLADQFGVCQGMVSAIVRRINWTHI